MVRILKTGIIAVQWYSTLTGRGRGFVRFVEDFLTLLAKYNTATGFILFVKGGGTWVPRAAPLQIAKLLGLISIFRCFALSMPKRSVGCA